MPICVFDTETDGLDDPIHLVELGVVLLDDDGRERVAVSLIVHPEGWTISNKVARIHGITTADAARLGVPLIVAISVLTNLWAMATVRVAHNLEFDDKVIATAMTLLGRTSTLPRPPGVCTVDLARPILSLPPTEHMIATGHGHEFKRPSLKECIKHFFNEDEIVGAHSALVDARACARVYLALCAAGSV